MKTYNSYEEAKIANPAGDIYINEIGSFQADDDDFILKSKKVGPERYCMTVEKFLADGHKFVEGDLYLNLDGHIITYKGMHFNSADEHGRNNKRYILRAAALETKEPKSTKVEYVPINNGNELVNFRNELFFKHDNGDYIWTENHTLSNILNHMDNNNLYRRVETEIDWDWWEEAASFVEEVDRVSNRASLLLSGKLCIEAVMTETQWKEFAKKLLS
ncbi:putative lipocalin family protein [Vibrio phage 277E43-1]|nr:putative lipocalin family protein [Vibrio phage 277E43-1]